MTVDHFRSPFSINVIHGEEIAGYLDEISKLRSRAWADSGMYSLSSSPEFWIDHLEAKSIHWVVRDFCTTSNSIIASARISLVDYISELCYPMIFQSARLPHLSPIGFYSRLVVDPRYQKQGISKLLDAKRLSFIDKLNIPLVVATAGVTRAKILSGYGFLSFGGIKSDLDPNWHFGSNRFLLARYRSV